jgi:hypothetical protein
MLLGNRHQIEDLLINTKELHISFRPSFQDLILIKKRCNCLKTIELADTMNRQFSNLLGKPSLTFLKLAGIKIVINTRQGQKRGPTHATKE